MMVNIAFIHPDLGIGGAERAIVDAAVALKSRGHGVTILTAHHDASHCFEETRNGTLSVLAVGDWLPRSFLGRCRAFFAYLRMIYVAFYLVFCSGISYDLIFCDQISACIPVLRCSRERKKVIFYCHFPDLLLTDRKNFMKRLYRGPLDWLEERSTGMADCILVNSQFTAGVFHDTFASLSHMTPDVLYPVPDCFNTAKPANDNTNNSVVGIPAHVSTLFVSINRYERKKNIALALYALGVLHDEMSSEEFNAMHLVVAGGYDELVSENHDCLTELRALAEQLDISRHVTFLCNIDSAQKHALLVTASCLLYTPDREHFGIVPVEAMHAHCPVIAVNSGGPRETVVNEVTGFLCDSSPHEFAAAMRQFTGDEAKALRQRLGEAGNYRVQQHFSYNSFTLKLDHIVQTLCSSA